MCSKVIFGSLWEIEEIWDMNNAYISELGKKVLQNPELAALIMRRLTTMTREERIHGIKIVWNGKEHIIRLMS